jgi:hypothetical protein
LFSGYEIPGLFGCLSFLQTCVFPTSLPLLSVCTNYVYLVLLPQWLFWDDIAHVTIDSEVVQDKLQFGWGLLM